MIKEFESLTDKEKELLLRATALVSLYAALLDGKLEEHENQEAKTLAHLRTYTAAPILRAYYLEIEPDFKKFYSEWMGKLPEKNQDKIDFLTHEIIKLNGILKKMENSFSIELKRSLLSYAMHISNSKKNLLESFLFPIDIAGLTETSVKSFNHNS